MIVLPSASQLADATTAFDQDWGGVDDVLYELCREHPGHADRRTATAKLALIGRAYSAGLERRVTPPKGQQAITVIAEFVHAHHSEVDAIIENKIPVSTLRSSSRLRPANRCRLGTFGISGSISSHSSSDTSGFAICTPSSQSKWTQRLSPPTRRRLHFVRRSKGASPLTFCASAKDTSQPCFSRMSCTRRAPFIDSVAA